MKYYQAIIFRMLSALMLIACASVSLAHGGHGQEVGMIHGMSHAVWYLGIVTILIAGFLFYFTVEKK